MENVPPQQPPRNLWFVAALLTATAVSLLVAIVLIVRNFDPPAGGPGGGPSTPKKLTREETTKLLDQRDRAVALLENHEFAKADELLSDIIRQVPDDPFGPRNLVICREQALGAIDVSREPSRHAEMLVKARGALELLSQVEPNSHVPHVLDARVSVRANEIDQAEVSLKKAGELAPKSAPVWYDLFLLRPIAPGEAPSAEVVEALRKAHELEPDNLFVLKDWLPLLAQLKDPSFADTAEKAKETVKPFADIIKTHARVDVLDLLDVVAKAAREDQWPLVTGRTMAVRNIMVSEAARDERYVKLDSLEYVLQDFGLKFYERAELPDVELEPAISLWLPPSKAHLPRANAVEVVDIDLDGQLDAAMLVRDRRSGDCHFVVSYRIAAIDSDEERRSSTTGCGQFQTGLCTIDLDDDVDHKLKDRPKETAGCHLADPDLIVFGETGVKLFENRATADGQREFIEKPTGTELGSLNKVLAVTPMDLDLDGDLDFFTLATDGLRLWSNRGNWSFEEITSRSKLPPENYHPSAVAVVDWDKDADLDILVSCVDGCGLLENIRHGRFRWRDFEGGFDSLKQSTTLLVEELDGNGSWDVIAAGAEGLRIILTRISPAGLVTVKRLEPRPAGIRAATRVAVADFDNDGVRDLIVHGSQAVLYRGLGDGTFGPWPNFHPGRLAHTSFLAVADLDRDGDQDVIVNDDEGLTIRNNEGNANGWLDVSLLAQQIKPNEQNYSKRVNHAGIGSTIELKAGSKYQAQVVTGPITHFGLGPRKKADIVRVIWTNGVPRNLIDPEPNLHICEEQKLVGSCPYLYAWDGEKFSFVTDLLWNAPLGLKFAENVVAPWREWEYLKIDGNQLKAREGEYQLRVTAELWEAEYFDQIKLFAIDHPAGTQIFTNEKVGPASLAEHTIHTVRSPRIPVAAKDTSGRDILDQVKARDGIYTKTYDNKLAHGLTNEHFLELDLGKWGRGTRDEGRGADRQKNETTGSPSLGPQPSSLSLPRITLFLTGWIYPTGTSLNVQFSQNPDMAQPRPPALHAIDANGQWREVRPFMGFPGGKTKTIAVDVSDVFPAGSSDHRLRIVTNMEFYWDAVFFTVDEEPVEMRQTELTLVRADLHERGGVSQREWPLTGNGPELFDYSRLVPGLPWPPMAGAFTRLGDVLPLLTERDDQLVVTGTGDEIRLAFAVPLEPLPAGWVRDFVIYSVGWDKDGDLNTVYGETVEPLPFRDMTVYAHRDGQPRPLDEDYLRYLRSYQTRHQARPRFWNEVRRRSAAN